jgi:hypothetical protein
MSRIVIRVEVWEGPLERQPSRVTADRLQAFIQRKADEGWTLRAITIDPEWRHCRYLVFARKEKGRER